MDPAVIMLRWSPDWGRLDAGYLQQTEAFDKIFHLPSHFISGKIELWDAMFSLSFYGTRQALKEIALANYAAVQDAALITAEEAEPPASPELAFFTDDDDWFAPDLVARLREPAAGHDGLTWDSVRFDGLLEPRDALPGHCFTNNYAVTRQYMTREPAWRATVGGPHYDANRNFRREDFDSFHVTSPLSMSNKHPCSITAFRYSPPGRDGLLRIVDDFNSRAAALRLPPELEWAAGPIEATTALFAGLTR